MQGRSNWNESRYWPTSSRGYTGKKAGRAGEEAVEQTLSEVIFPVGTQVFRNLSLLIRKNFRIEIDVLILTPVFALILEVKNIAGTLSFNEEEGKTVRI